MEDEDLNDHVVQLCDSYMYQGNVKFDDKEAFRIFLLHLFEVIGQAPTDQYILVQWAIWQRCNKGYLSWTHEYFQLMLKSRME